MSDKFENLERLGNLLDQGKLTLEEYERLKQELLEGSDSHSEETSQPRERGWYNDPSEESLNQAYWDGEKWTGATRPGRRPCAACQQPVAVEARKCPHCGHPQPATEETKNRAMWIAAVVVAIIALVWLATFASGQGVSSSATSPASRTTGTFDSGSVGQAFYTCELLVLDSLTSPATAKFHGPGSDVTESLGGGRYVVTTYVDSQDDSGAALRIDVSCTVEHRPGEGYKVTRIVLSE